MMAVLHERRSCWEESMNNPYKVLGVSEGASQEEIRAAYLKLVKKYHLSLIHISEPTRP